MNLLKARRSACFFELDGVIRQLLPEVVDHYKDQYEEVPAAPLKLREQTLIEPVVTWIKDYCQRTGAIPIGVDQAPYLSYASEQFGEAEYLAILDELKGMLHEAGLRVRDIVFCPHAGEELIDYAPGTVVGPDGAPVATVQPVTRIVPDCKCKFPNPDLFKGAAERYGITVMNVMGNYRFFDPSIFVHRTPEGHQAALGNANLNCRHVNSILSGVFKLPGMVENVHRSAAALIRDHQKRKGLKDLRGEGRTIDLNARDMPDLPHLPPRLDTPSTELSPR